MDNSPEYLPSNLKGKKAGVFLQGVNIFMNDVALLGGDHVSIDHTTAPGTVDDVDYFLIDAKSIIGPHYLTELQSALNTYRSLAAERSMYAAILYKEMNYQWDVYNEMSPSVHGDGFPGARYVYDSLLADFAVRAISNIPLEGGVRSMLLRLTPLGRTVMCIMAASGRGKTTFVRQLKRTTGSFHVSSDCLLSSILNMKASEANSDQVTTIKRAIDTVPANQIWSRFFRMIEEDDILLNAFLEIVILQLTTSGDNRLVSFDIDARNQETRLKIRDFFEKRGLKTWICTT